MQAIKIYGCSDDLIEVEGHVPGCDEYGSYDTPGFVAFSTGDVFKAEYGEQGVWKVDHVKESGKLTVTKSPHGEGDDPEPYTETVTATGPIEWVELWESWPPRDDEVRDKIHKFFEGRGAGDLSDDKAAKVFEIITGKTIKV